MRRISVLLTFLPAALVAQTPAQTPAPTPAPTPAQVPAPAQAPVPAAPSLDAQVKAQSPAINDLLKTDPAAALVKVEALIPAQAPAFDKTGIKGAQASINDYEALSELYSLGANAAMSIGQWEKARDYAAKAKSTAQATYDNAVAPLTAFQDTWKNAAAEGQKNLDELATLSKLEKPDADQIKRLQVLLKREDVDKGNVKNGKQMVDAVSASLNGLKAAPGNYDAAIADIDKHLKDEADYLDKLKKDKRMKGDPKREYATALLHSPTKTTDKAAYMAGLRRALVLDPTNSDVADAIAGKESAKPVPHKGKKKSK